MEARRWPTRLLMWRSTPIASGRSVILLPVLTVILNCLACTPMVDVAGVYFPGWLVAGVTSVGVAYAIVWLLGRRPASRELAASGLFFSSLVVGIALAIWWMLFSGF